MTLTEEDQWKVMKLMARLERNALEIYRFDCANSLFERAKVMIFTCKETTYSEYLSMEV